MGLNLNIRRIIFHSVHKREGAGGEGRRDTVWGGAV